MAKRVGRTIPLSNDVWEIICKAAAERTNAARAAAGWADGGEYTPCSVAREVLTRWANEKKAEWSRAVAG